MVMRDKKMHIGIVAGEASGDTLGANLIEQLKQLYPNIQFSGIGGAQMQRQGLHSCFPMERLAVMGLVEVLSQLRQLFAVRDGLLAYWQDNPIDVFIGIDSPDFNLRVARLFKDKGIPTVQYVSPSVWAWRQQRVHSIKQAVDLVLCLFPFEVEFYQRYNVPAYFVGHPLADQLWNTQIDVHHAREQIGWSDISKQSPVVALLAGSRQGEVSRLAPVFFETAASLLQAMPNMRFVVPAINAARAQQLQESLIHTDSQVQQAVTIIEAQHYGESVGRLAMQAADVVLAASGTASLEALFLARPMVVAYRLHWLSFLLLRWLIRIPYVALPNILAKHRLVDEHVQQQANAMQLSQSVLALLQNSTHYEQQKQALSALHQQLTSQQANSPAEMIGQLLDAHLSVS